MTKQLLFSITRKDFDIHYFSGKGAGGQHRNKNQNCVRLKHKDSGVMTTGQSHKERSANLKEAFKNLIEDPHFKIWHNQKVLECTEGQTIEERIQEMLKPIHLKIEVKKDGKWIRDKS